jgi:hypothetical protein
MHKTKFCLQNARMWIYIYIYIQTLLLNRKASFIAFVNGKSQIWWLVNLEQFLKKATQCP